MLTKEEAQLLVRRLRDAAVLAHTAERRALEVQVEAQKVRKLVGAAIDAIEDKMMEGEQ